MLQSRVAVFACALALGVAISLNEETKQMPNIGDIIAKAQALEAQKNAPPPPPPAPGKKQKVDVGFTGFVHNVTTEVGKVLMQDLNSTFPETMSYEAQLVDTLGRSLNASLVPLKKKVAECFVNLTTAQKQADFIQQTHDKFLPIFKGASDHFTERTHSEIKMLANIYKDNGIKMKKDQLIDGLEHTWNTTIKGTTQNLDNYVEFVFMPIKLFNLLQVKAAQIEVV